MFNKLLLVLKGFLMGIADVIPGVSGGTMALILGIYEQLVKAIRNIDLKFIKFLFSINFYKRIPAHIKSDAPLSDDELDIKVYSVVFLVFLVLGILIAGLTGVRIIPFFMDNYPAQTSGFFFGLIVASIAVPFRMMERKGFYEFVIFLIFAIGTFFLVGMNISNSSYARGELKIVKDPAYKVVKIPGKTIFQTRMFEGKAKLEIKFNPLKDYEIKRNEETIKIIATRAGKDCNLKPGSIVDMKPQIAGVQKIIQEKPTHGGKDPSLLFVFLSGVIGICAMILPGISGAFILLLLGMYGYIIFTVHSIIYGRDFSKILVLMVFLIGIVIGILAFSRLLNYLLKKYHSLTMAALVGLMVGSLRKIWPFQKITPVGYENYIPSQWSSVVTATLITFAAGFLIVTVLNYVGIKKDKESHAKNS